MLLEAVVTVFVLTQLAYCVGNGALVSLLVRRPDALVDDGTLERVTAEGAETERNRTPVRSDGGSDGEIGSPSTDVSRPASEPRPPVRSNCRLPGSAIRRIHVLVPIYRETSAVLAETLDNIAAQRYPTEAVSVSVIHEPDDPTVSAIRESVAAREDDLDVEFVAVDRAALAADRAPGDWTFSGTGIPRTKAAALTYAFTTRSLAADDVVTVFDSDTQVPLDTFELAVAGLTEYDIVQAKQTVRNVDDGLLPLLESMGIAAWSDLIYTNSAGGPYQLLGKAYFVPAGVLYDLDRWQLDAVTEDMALGVAAHERGCTLGIIDRYVQDLCPAALEAWVRQKRRWVRGPYRHLLTPSWSGRERGRFWAGTVLTQLLSVTNVLGLPAGLAVLWLTVTGSAGAVPAALTPVIAFNGVVWCYYSWRSYRAAWEAVAFDGRWERGRYSLLSNPITQALYATLWAVPICLALADAIRGATPTFDVTPKN
ncbi:glycosyltransferase family 2 protein [Natrinema altunense]|uniref:Glycosyltransferase 2-like domain-containing protein n=1 Tax=Natrinema altunense (strain JCM 12890 / CGMCC 1.3731 / AJ2) TaxID=1227494 RepID=L9ZMD8_NATA2|nr:glycosyltransferase family 2 protein [Natrinema altunense]ELY86328.1 hypothetical protein C485_10030 [Natrinema altunense JCM 12890]